MTDPYERSKAIREFEVNKSEHGAWVTIELNVPFGADMDVVDALLHEYRNIKIETANKGYPSLTLYADTDGMRERIRSWTAFKDAGSDRYEWESVMNATGTVAVRRSAYTDIDIRMDVFGDDRIVASFTANLYAQEARELVENIRWALETEDSKEVTRCIPLRDSYPEYPPLGRIYVFRAPLDATPPPFEDEEAFKYKVKIWLVNNGSDDRVKASVRLTEGDARRLIELMEGRLDA